MRINRRKIKFYRRKINYVLTLSIIILLFTIGYAFLNTTININGTGYIDRAEWNVHFTNIQVKNGSVVATTAPTISNNTSISFSALLDNPGDFYEFTVDIENTGTIPAMIDSFSITPTLTSEQANYFNYSVTYLDGSALADKYLLNVNDSETIKISFLYKELANNNLYPIEDQNFQFNLTIDYVQADSTAVERTINYMFFNINNTSYLAQENMTWDNWLSSPLNTSSFIIDNTNQIVKDGTYYLKENEEEVESGTFISRGVRYTAISSEGILEPTTNVLFSFSIFGNNRELHASKADNYNSYVGDFLEDYIESDYQYQEVLPEEVLEQIPSSFTEVYEAFNFYILDYDSYFNMDLDFNVAMPIPFEDGQAVGCVIQYYDIFGELHFYYVDAIGESDGSISFVYGIPDDLDVLERVGLIVISEP